MNDLHDHLERLSAPEHDWLADSHALLHEGRRRVRRRRLAGSAVACVAVVAVGGVGVAQLGGSSPDAVRPAATSYADLDLTPLTNAEVEQRCPAAVRLMDPESPLTDFVVPDSITQPNPENPPTGKNYQTPKPWHTGTRVLVMPRTKAEWRYYGGPTACTIPAAGVTPHAFTRVGTASQLQGDCADNLGIDISGWQQVTASSDGTAALALYRSGNGFLVHCYVDDDGFVGVEGQAWVMSENNPDTPEDRWTPEGRCWLTADHHTECIGDGRLDDHTASQVDVTLPSGRVVRTDAVDGYWSITVQDDATGRWEGKPGETFATKPVS